MDQSLTEATNTTYELPCAARKGRMNGINKKRKTMKILMVITSHDQLGNMGRKTGFWLEEFVAPYYAAILNRRWPSDYRAKSTIVDLCRSEAAKRARC